MSDTSLPLVTIAIPNYNMARYLEGAVESALRQTFQNFEIVIVNNSSTDNSLKIIECLTEKDPRVKLYHYEKHEHPLGNWNRCLKMAKGNYIVFLHADDLLKPQFLESCLNIYKKNPELGYVYAEKENIDEQGNISKAPTFYKESAIIPGLEEARVNLLGWHTAPVQMLVRTDCMREIGGYEFTDTLPVLRLNIGWDVGYVSTPLVQYRVHQESSTTHHIKDKTLIQSLYLSKMLLIGVLLPPHAAHLKELKPRILQRTAYSCLSIYAMGVLGRNEVELCNEYMHLAMSFWLGIEKDPLYLFLTKAREKKDWSTESLLAAWAEIRPPATAAGAPYDLPEGSFILSQNKGPTENKLTI